MMMDWDEAMDLAGIMNELAGVVWLEIEPGVIEGNEATGEEIEKEGDNCSYFLSRACFLLYFLVLGPGKSEKWGS